MRYLKSQWEKRVRRSLQERWRGLQGEGEEDGGKVQREGGEGQGKGEGEGEEEKEEEGGAEDKEDNQLLSTNLTRTKVIIKAEMQSYNANT